MKINEEEQLQISIVQLFHALKFKRPVLINGKAYKLNQPDAVLISNRNESGINGKKGRKVGWHFNRMGRYPGELDLKLIYNHSKNPRIAYIELKTPSRYKETGCYKKDGTPKPGINKYSLENSQVNFIKNVCVKLNIPVLIACSIEQFINFLLKLNLLEEVNMTKEENEKLPECEFCGDEITPNSKTFRTNECMKCFADQDGPYESEAW